jgi:hypothetical protein
VSPEALAKGDLMYYVYMGGRPPPRPKRAGNSDRVQAGNYGPSSEGNFYTPIAIFFILVFFLF